MISNADLLSDQLRQLQLTRDDMEDQRPQVHDGYGFRPPSGVSTPLQNGAASPLPDPNGLGWPGTHPLSSLARSLPPAAKATVSRLNATPLERTAREKRMVSAVRTILECIGEDPDREGLVKTPERYAQAIMWMTRGYEERLAGALPSHPLLLT